MSVWPVNESPSLEGADGELICIRITIEPRLLERLLDVLARLEFPINPQLYHDAATIYLCPDGSRLVQPATMVEFPAWTDRLPKIKDALVASAFGEECLTVKGMLDDIRSKPGQEPAPPGAPYKTIVRSKHALRATA
jgi:hypothetical protein